MMSSPPKQSTRRAFLKGAAGVGVMGLDALFAPGARSNELHVGSHAPPAVLVTLDGKRIATKDLLGSVVILTFWATWCGPCRQELPLLSEYAKQNASLGLAVLGFTLDPPEALDKVRRAAQDFSFPVGFVENSSLPGYGRIWRIPVNFAIDRQGRLIDDGWRDKQAVWTQERLDQVITPLLSPAR